MSKEFEAVDLTPLTKENFKAAALEIGCEPAAIHAVAVVEEGGRRGFLSPPDNRLVILFESHAFHTQTKGIYDKSHPGISTSTWVHNYGPGGNHQYDRLYEAIALNREAALKSASWGMFQIMGFNFYNAGYDTVEEFVTDMCQSEAAQLEAFVLFCQNTGCDEHLINKDWSSFARSYNGSGQIAFYANKIKDAYNLSIKQGYNS